MEIYKSDISKDSDRRTANQTVGGAELYVSQDGASVGGLSLATQAWTEENYVSKKFFERLFSVHGDGTTLVDANDMSTEVESLESKIGLWTNSYISALGQNSSQGGGSGTSYNRLDTWSSYDSTKSGWVLSALLGNDLNTRLTTLENGVAPISHTHAWSDITSTPSTIAGYGITDAYISSGSIVLGNNTITPITSLAGYATENYVATNFLGIHATADNADTVDGYHALEVCRAWYILSQYYDETNTPWWYKICAKTSTTTDDIENDWMIEISAYGDQNHASHIHGYLRATYYGQDVAIVLSTNPACNVGTALQLRATVDSNGDVWLGLIANFSGRLSFRILHEGANNHVIRSGWTMQRTDPNSVYIVNNGAYSPAHLAAIQKLYMTNVIAECANRLNTSRTIWGQGFDGTDNVSGNLTFMTGSSGMYGIVPNRSGHWDLSIYTEGQPRLTIKDNGNVGIGTTSPSATLHVAGTALFNSYVGINGSADSNYALKVNGSAAFTTDGSNQVRFLGAEACDIVIGDGQNGNITNLGNLSGLRKYIEFDWYTSYWRIGNVRGGGADTDGFGIVSGANTLKLLVGNNSTRVFSDLSVDYSINASGTIHSTTGIYSEGYVSALGQNTSSDERLKDVQGDICLPIDVLSNAPSKIFEWKNNKALGTQVGTIAQYWQKALPQVVHENNGYLAMQYDVTALLGVISLAKNVKSHEERIAELEREIEMLNQELETLKN